MRYILNIWDQVISLLVNVKMAWHTYVMLLIQNMTITWASEYMPESFSTGPYWRGLVMSYQKNTKENMYSLDSYFNGDLISLIAEHPRSSASVGLTTIHCSWVGKCTQTPSTPDEYRAFYVKHKMMQIQSQKCHESNSM